MGSLVEASFWIDLGERAVRTFAQATLAVLGTVELGTTTGLLSLPSLPWLSAFQIGGLAAAISVLIGLAGIRLGDKMTASFLPPPEESPQAFKAVPQKMMAMFHHDEGSS